MVDEATTWGALLERRRDVSFVGREQAIADFRLNMVHEVPPALLFFVYGPEGIGKSALLARYRGLAEEHGFLTARIDGAQAQADPESAVLAVLNAIAGQFADQGTPLTTFAEQYADYLDALDAIAEDPQAPAPPLDWFEGVHVKGEWHQRFWTPYLATRFSARLMPVLRQPVPSLTSVFVSDLNAWASIRRLILFFDDWRTLGSGVQRWLVELLREGALHINVWMAIADVAPPDDVWRGLAPVMRTQPLDPLSEREVRDYGRIHPSLSGDCAAEAYAVTRGIPLLLDLLAEVESLVPYAEDVPIVRSYLDSLESLKREAVLESAAARRLSPRVMAALLGDEGETAFTWLKRSPLLVAQDDAWVFHARVRDRVRAWAYETQPEDWMAAHARLGAYYQNQDEDAFERGRGKRVRRRVRTRERLYHRLVAGGMHGQVQAHQAFLDALRADYRWAAEVVAIWQAASETPGAPESVTAWASRLTKGWDALRAKDWTSALAFCDEILGKEALDASLQTGYGRLRNWVAGRLGLPLEEEDLEPEEEATQEVAAATASDASVAAESLTLETATTEPGVESMAEHAAQDAEPAAQTAEPAVQTAEPAARSPEPSETVLSSSAGAAGGVETPLEAASEAQAPPEPDIPEESAEESFGARMIAKAQATCERANAFFKEGEYLSAVQLYSRAIDQDPSTVSAYFNRGLTHLKLNEIGAAIDDFSQVLALDPENPSARYQRGMAYLRRDELTLAIEDFEMAISVMPKSAVLYAQRAIAYYRLQAYQRALDDYTEALTLKPTEITFLLNRGLTYMAMGEAERAMEDYDRAIEQAPDHALAYYYRGQAHMQQSEERKAQADFEEALRLEPNNAQMQMSLGMVHARMLDFDQALAAYERAMALDAENARIYYNAACAAALSEREEQALVWLEKAIALRSQYRIMARQDPDFSFIRDHPAFRRLISA